MGSRASLSFLSVYSFSCSCSRSRSRFWYFARPFGHRAPSFSRRKLLFILVVYLSSPFLLVSGLFGSPGSLSGRLQFWASLVHCFWVEFSGSPSGLAFFVLSSIAFVLISMGHPRRPLLSKPKPYYFPGSFRCIIDSEEPKVFTNDIRSKSNIFASRAARTLSHLASRSFP